MIKILHTGDIHLGDLAGPTKDGANLRRQDTLRCMDAIVNKARTEGPTVTMITPAPLRSSARQRRTSRTYTFTPSRGWNAW